MYLKKKKKRNLNAMLKNDSFSWTFCSLFILKFCVTIFYYHETSCPLNPNAPVNTINQDPETIEQVPDVKISNHLV